MERKKRQARKKTTDEDVMKGSLLYSQKEEPKIKKKPLDYCKIRIKFSKGLRQ